MNMDKEKLKKILPIAAVAAAVVVVIIIIVTGVIKSRKQAEAARSEELAELREEGYLLSESEEKVAVITLTYPEDRSVESVTLTNVSSGEDAGDLLNGSGDFYLATGVEEDTYQVQVVLDNGETVDAIFAVGDEAMYYIDLSVGESGGETEETGETEEGGETGEGTENGETEENVESGETGEGAETGESAESENGESAETGEAAESDESTEAEEP